MSVTVVRFQACHPCAQGDRLSLLLTSVFVWRGTLLFSAPAAMRSRGVFDAVRDASVTRRFCQTIEFTGD